MYNTVSVANTATLIVGDNPQRLSLIVVNASTANVYIGQDALVTTANGTLIVAEGNLTEDSGGTKMYCGPIYGITPNSNADIRYWERER